MPQRYPLRDGPARRTCVTDPLADTRDDVVVNVTIDPASRVPASRQIRERLVAMIRRGRLLPGDRLPAVRDLAASVNLAPNTVAKAYRELVAGGYLVALGRRGTFVAERLPELQTPDERALDGAADAYARRATQLGCTAAQARAALDRALEK
jgi:DNA-binding transcriptional regulator YhcF (GntR family)